MNRFLASSQLNICNNNKGNLVISIRNIFTIKKEIKLNYSLILKSYISNNNNNNNKSTIIKDSGIDSILKLSKISKTKTNNFKRSKNNKHKITKIEKYYSNNLLCTNITLPKSISIYDDKVRENGSRDESIQLNTWIISTINNNNLNDFDIILSEELIRRMDLTNLITILFHVSKMKKIMKNNNENNDTKIFVINNEKILLIANQMKQVFLIRNYKKKINDITIGNLLYSLSMFTYCDENLSILIDSISDIIENCSDNLSPQAVSNSLYGLQGLSSKYLCIRKLLPLLSNLLVTCDQPLGAKEVSAALYGLKSLNSNHNEVRILLKSIPRLIQSCKEPLSAQVVSNSLIGFKNLNSNSIEVRNIIKEFNLLLKNSDIEQLQTRHITSCIHGLSSFDSKHSEVKDLLETLNYIFLSSLEPPSFDVRTLL
jgi:hypothetical protein